MPLSNCEVHVSASPTFPASKNPRILHSLAAPPWTYLQTSFSHLLFKEKEAKKSKNERFRKIWNGENKKRETHQLFLPPKRLAKIPGIQMSLHPLDPRLQCVHIVDGECGAEGVEDGLLGGEEEVEFGGGGE